MTTNMKEPQNRISTSEAVAMAPPAKSGPGPLTYLILLAVCAVLAFVIYSGIHSRIQAEAQLVHLARESAIPAVDVIHPTEGSSSSEIALPGSTQAFTDTPIYARTSGYLKSWFADIGTQVKQGQLLVEIDAPELDQQLQQAQADLKNAQANLRISQTTSTRYQTLMKSNSVSQEETDQALSDLQSKQALVDSSAANVRRLLQLQSYEKIYAPFSGVITARNTDIGNLVQGGDNSTSKELFHLAAIDKLRIYIPLPEVYASTVKSGNQVTLTLDSFPGETFTGIIARTSDAIDPATRTLNVEVDVDNPGGRLMPGAYAFVHLKVPSQTGAVTIPSSTLLFRAEGLRVGVVRDGHATLVPVSIGHDYGSSVEVVSGLTPNDAVILDPPDSLVDGAQVQSQSLTQASP